MGVTTKRARDDTGYKWRQKWGKIQLSFLFFIIGYPITSCFLNPHLCVVLIQKKIRLNHFSCVTW